MKFSYRGLTHSEAPRRGCEIFALAPPASILAKRFPEKSDEAKSDLRVLVILCSEEMILIGRARDSVSFSESRGRRFTGPERDISSGFSSDLKPDLAARGAA